jgi:hypothetical protein
VADQATSPQIYDEEGTCRSTKIIFLDGSVLACLIDMVVGLPVDGGHGVKDSNEEGGQRAVADEATPPKLYDEQGTCRSAAVFDSFFFNTHLSLYLLLISYTGSGVVRRFPGGREGSRQWQTRPLAPKSMMKKGHAEALPIFSSMGQVMQVSLTWWLDYQWVGGMVPRI